MKRGLVIVSMLLIGCSLFGQRYFTRTGEIKFFSEAPMENIEAVNNKVLCIIDLDKGQVAVDLLIKSFEFEKKLMQEHFNENYMESSKIPKATFKGQFEVPDDLKELENGEYVVDVTGEITIHGIKQPLNTRVMLRIREGQIESSFEFMVKVEDHEIEIPNLVIDNIAEEILVSVNLTLEPYKR